MRVSGRSVDSILVIKFNLEPAGSLRELRSNSDVWLWRDGWSLFLLLPTCESPCYSTSARMMSKRRINITSQGPMVPSLRWYVRGKSAGRTGGRYRSSDRSSFTCVLLLSFFIGIWLRLLERCRIVWLWRSDNANRFITDVISCLAWRRIHAPLHR